MNQVAGSSKAVAGANADYERLLEATGELAGNVERVLVAFSGGVDSALVVKAALDALGAGRVLAVTAASPAVPARELRGAREFAEDVGVEFRVVRTRESKREEYLRNHRDRCFHCKSELYGRLFELAAEIDASTTTIFNGTNTDDLGDVRPGLEAARQANVGSPLVVAGFGKERVRAVARMLELVVWDKPASPCLASRVPFFERISPEILARIERAEDGLIALGLRELRVRHHDDLARIEVPEGALPRLLDPAIRQAAVDAVREAGYRYVTLDLAGLRSGEFNRPG